MTVMDKPKRANGPKDPLAGDIIDCDIHSVLPGGLKTVFPYLDRAQWRARDPSGREDARRGTWRVGPGLYRRGPDRAARNTGGGLHLHSGRRTGDRARGP